MITPASTMKWLIKRELWEHKGGFFWAPIVVGGILTLFVILSLAAVVLGTSGAAQINGVPIEAFAAGMTDADKLVFVSTITRWYMGASTPLFLLLGFVVFFFCLNALFDERKDRSILFWKSLPVTDDATVISKALLAMVVAPAITLVIAIVTSMLVLLLICVAMTIKGVSLSGYILTSPATYLAPLQWVALLPIYALWALPAAGWLLMVGAWTRTKPFLWAVGVPLLAGVLVSWLDKLFQFGWDLRWFWKNIVGRGLLSVVPGSWFNAGDMAIKNRDFGDHNEAEMLSQSWQLLGTANLWLGVIVGAAMIYAAIRIRRWKDDG